MKRWLVAAVATLAAYTVILLLLGWLAGGYLEGRVRDRLAESLDARVTIDDVSVDLLRGNVTLRGIHIVRDQGGYMTVDIERIDVDIAAFGLVVFRRDPDRVRARGVTIVLSALAMRKRPPKPPIDIGELEVRDVQIVIMPSSYMPKLGRISLEVEHARTRPMQLRSALSWVFYLKELDANIELPIGERVGLGYRDEHLTLRAALFGAEPLAVHFPLPAPDPDALEAEQIKTLAKSLGKVLLTKAGPALIKRKIKDAWDAARR